MRRKGSTPLHADIDNSLMDRLKGVCKKHGVMQTSIVIKALEKEVSRLEKVRPVI